MAGEFKHYIDDVLLSDEPEGWKNFVINLVRDVDAQALIAKYPISLTFFGDGWEILKTTFDSDEGYCQDLDYRVEKRCDAGFRRLFEGKIFISQIDFNLNKCTAAAQIEDNSFFARVFNNKNIEATLDVNQSKNEVSITAAAQFDLTVYTPSTGAILGTTRKAIDIKDAFTYLVQFMSDGEIGLRSDFYDNLPDDESTCILLGDELRIGASGGTVPTISFEDLFDSQRKIYNLLMTVETDFDGSVFLRIEDDEFFFGTTNAFDLTKIDDMVENVREELLFSKVVFGSPGSGTLGTLPQITFVTWNDEEFVISGQCNSDNALELEVDTVINSNVIESILGGSTDFDEDLVTIQYTKSTSTATKTNPLDNAPVDTLYNEQYLNSIVSTRYDLQGNITKFIGDGNDGFRASNTASSFIAGTNPVGTSLFPFPFNDDSTFPNNDPNGNYDNVLFRYISPLDGIYTFTSTLFYRWNTLSALNGRVTIFFERYTAGSILIQSVPAVLQTQNTANPAPNTPYTVISPPVGLNVLTGEYVAVRVEAFVFGGAGPLSGALEVLASSSFEATATANGGGLFEEKDGDEYRVIGVQYDRALSDDQIRIITGSPFLSVLVDHDGVTKKKTYINNVNINAYTGETNWQMIRNVNET